MVIKSLKQFFYDYYNKQRYIKNYIFRILIYIKNKESEHKCNAENAGWSKFKKET